VTVSGVRTIFLLLLLQSLDFAYGQITAEEGIPVTDALVKSKCGSCHTSDERGTMKRISWERATPEAWQRAIQRMVLLDDVELTPAEAARVIQYLSTSHGLAPDEAKQVTYDVERRIHDESEAPKALTSACGRCHNLARVLSWRRSADDWKELSQAHALRYNVPPNDEAIAFLAGSAPLRTAAWTTWSRRKVATGLSGRWLVTASLTGHVLYTGEMQFEPTAMDMEFKTRATLRSVLDGSTVTRRGQGVMYGGCAWRGVSRGDTVPGLTPDSLSSDAHEVMTASSDGASFEGRWFWGQYQELGFDVNIRRSSLSPTLLAMDPPLIKAGSQSKRIRLFGDQLPPQISISDLTLGTGIQVRRIISHDSSEILAEVDVAGSAPAGKRRIAVRGTVLADAFAVYDHIDYIKVTPESAMAAFGDETRTRGYQQFEAIGYLNGADGKRHTIDDVELGPVEVTWSMKVFYENEGANTDSVGSVNAAGLFIPAERSPKNNFDVWVMAQARDEKNRDHEPLTGKAYLVVTVPVYIFNGRRYVRDLDRWVDDGPATPLRQK
jgi:quinohemoprotein amine dehydrogenase